MRAGLVTRPEEYKWSSAAVYLGLAKDRYSLLDNEFWTEYGGAEGWAELLAEEDEASDLMLLRRCTFAGRPYGEQEYVAVFEERFGRVWRRWGFEKESQVRTFAG